MGAITVEQLIRSPNRLVDEAESGEVAIVTKGGRALFLAVPIDDRLAKEDVLVAVAVRLYDRGFLSLGRSASVAGLSVSEFVDRLAALGIPVARYSPEELAREISEFG